MPSRPRRVSVLDALLLLMVFVWGLNYSLMKLAFQEVPFMAFNALRFSVASVVFAVGIAVTRWRVRRQLGPVDRTFYTREMPTRRDWFDLAWLGIVGHCGYQLCWAGALTLTSASNGALIIGATPIVVTTASALLGDERISRKHWAGIVISLLGVYFVVGHGVTSEGSSLKGDLLMVAAVGCWAVYTLGGSRLMARHSPLYVTGTTIVIGTAVYVLMALPSLQRVEWSDVDPRLWGLLLFTAIFPVNIAYIVWHAAVHRLGAARTSIYSNLVPLVAIGFAAVWLGEALTWRKGLGVAAVLGGVALTRLARPSPAVAIEE